MLLRDIMYIYIYIFESFNFINLEFIIPKLFASAKHSKAIIRNIFFLLTYLIETADFRILAKHRQEVWAIVLPNLLEAVIRFFIFFII